MSQEKEENPKKKTKKELYNPINELIKTMRVESIQHMNRFYDGFAKMVGENDSDYCLDCKEDSDYFICNGCMNRFCVECNSCSCYKCHKTFCLECLTHNECLCVTCKSTTEKNNSKERKVKILVMTQDGELEIQDRITTDPKEEDVKIWYKCTQCGVIDNDNWVKECNGDCESKNGFVCFGCINKCEVCFLDFCTHCSNRNEEKDTWTCMKCKK
jgi:hypothetical protein